MSLNPRTVANEFIRQADLAGRPITHLQVQKLTYLAHAFMLALHNRPLIHQEFEAWSCGPINPAIYHCLEYYGGEPVDAPILAHTETIDPQEQSIIDQVSELYGPLHGTRLSGMANADGTPWHQTWKKRRRHIVISDKLLRNHYRKMVQRHRQKPPGCRNSHQRRPAVCQP